MNNNWVALCTVAVGVVYTAGYVVTDSNSAHASARTAQPPTVNPAKVTHSANSPRSFYRERGDRFGHIIMAFDMSVMIRLAVAISMLEEQILVLALVQIQVQLRILQALLHPQVLRKQLIKMAPIRDLEQIDLEPFLSLSRLNQTKLPL